MRNKKSILSLGIIVLILFLGVGYAVVSSVYLNIGGTASVANADLKVEITNAVASTTVAEKTVDFNHTLSTDKLSSNFTLNGMELNETVSITYTVTNNETDVDAELALASGVDLTNSNADFFDVDYEITDSETDLENDDKTMEVVVNVSLIQTPVTESEGTTTVGLKLTASPKGGSIDTGTSSSELISTPMYTNYYYIDKDNDSNLRAGITDEGLLVVLDDGFIQIYPYADYPDRYRFLDNNFQINNAITSTDGSIVNNWSTFFTISEDKKIVTSGDLPLYLDENSPMPALTYANIYLADEMEYILFERNMTWRDYLDKYSTIGFIIDDNGNIYNETSGYITYDNGDAVFADDPITEKYKYYRFVSELS